MRKAVLKEKNRCCGCGACAALCPHEAIEMRPDEEGFLYPAIDPGHCVDCGLCERRCPALSAEPRGEKPAYAARVKEEGVREDSSSGGIFTALARTVLRRGGVVFGAAMDAEFHVSHVGVMEESALRQLRGSKYVQSDADDAYRQTALLLEAGLPVFFTGTPCQVAGLYATLGGDRENLLTADIVCHGVPSPAVFDAYLKMLEAERGAKLTRYVFRDKRKGWKDFSVVATFEDGAQYAAGQQEDVFMRGFLGDLYLRPSCHGCPYVGERRPGDITLGDMWGAQEIVPDMEDDRGLSLVFTNSEKGIQAFEEIQKETDCRRTDPKRNIPFCPPLVRSYKPHRNRARFFKQFEREGFSRAQVDKLLAPPGRAEKLARRIVHLPAGALRRLKEAIKQS